jgi:hypothetical protein
MPTEHKCSTCYAWKPVSSFFLRRGIPGSVCRSCSSAEAKTRTTTTRYKSRAKHLRKHYGLSPDQVITMRDRQENRCAICRVDMAPPGSGATAMVVDHCHATNRVRALLCNHCNRVLGFARDDANVLRSAAAYLDEHTEREVQRVASWR